MTSPWVLSLVDRLSGSISPSPSRLTFFLATLSPWIPPPHTQGVRAVRGDRTGVRQKVHIWVDGSLRDAEWYTKVFKEIKEKHPEYRIAILYVYASIYSVLERTKLRGRMTGRVELEWDILESLMRVPGAVEHLASDVDFLAWIWDEVVTRFGHLHSEMGREEICRQLDMYLGSSSSNEAIMRALRMANIPFGTVECDEARRGSKEVSIGAEDCDGQVEDGLGMQVVIAQATV
eukprot:768739-Hanusia_phi.AAC.4